MLDIHDASALASALASPLDPTLKALLCLRRERALERVLSGRNFCCACLGPRRVRRQKSGTRDQVSQ